jgi:NADH-quinone oxidoreductase subunit A
MTSGISIWFPVAVMLAGAAVVVGGMITVNRLIGPRNPGPKVKGEAFECGNPSTGSAWGRFSVRFYLTAILFLVFDVEIVFLYPWAAELRQLGVVGLSEALVFIAILLAGLVYAWQRGAFDWD